MSVEGLFFSELRALDRILAIDLETTSTVDGIRIIEMGGVLVERGQVVNSFSELINPDCRIQPAATSIHGISDQDVYDKPLFRGIWQLYMPMFCDAIVVAHNAIFDAGVLTGEIWRTRQSKLAADWWCTLKFARNLWPYQFSSYRLSSLATTLDIKMGHQHRALPDAETTLELFSKEVAFANSIGLGDADSLRRLSALRARIFR